MATQIIPPFLKDWEALVQALPIELEESARRYGALTRARKITTAQELLRLILLYSLVGSLRVGAALAAALGIDLSAQALQERIHQAEAWLKALLGAMLAALLPETGKPLGRVVRRVKLVDATVLARRGSPGVEWRGHLTWDPYHLQVTHLRITGAETGEGFAPEALEAGDLVIADRGYGHWRHFSVALAAKAFFLVRLPWNTLRWAYPNGDPFDLIAWLRTLPRKEGGVEEVEVVVAQDKERRPLRLIAARLPAKQARQAKERAEKQARKKKRQVHPHTLLAAEFVLLVTNLPPQIPAETVLAWYRIRWQIEWWFRRWKSLCGLDELPSYPAGIGYPVLLAKVLMVLFLQWLYPDTVWETWWAKEPQPPALSRLVQIGYEALRHLIIPQQSLLLVLSRPWAFARHLRLSKRRRSSQLQRLRTLAAQLATLSP